MYIYYVYSYLRQDGSPYYIGKGKGSRYKESHNVSIPFDKSKIIFLETNLSEVGALALERRYIRWYGRKDNNTGILRNLTDGGEGLSGIIHTPERNAKISKALKGIKRTKEQCENMRKSHIGIQAGEKNSMFGRKHTQQVKDEHSQRMQGNQWNVGKIWIHNLIELRTTSILKNDAIPEGWHRGMLPRRHIVQT